MATHLRYVLHEGGACLSPAPLYSSSTSQVDREPDALNIGDSTCFSTDATLWGAAIRTLRYPHATATLWPSSTSTLTLKPKDDVWTPGSRRRDWRWSLVVGHWSLVNGFFMQVHKFVGDNGVCYIFFPFSLRLLLASILAILMAPVTSSIAATSVININAKWLEKERQDWARERAKQEKILEEERRADEERRQLERREKERKERQKKEEEDRKRDAIARTSLKVGHCLHYGIREYSAVISQVPVGFDSVRYESHLMNVQDYTHWEAVCITAPADINGRHYDGQDRWRNRTLLCRSSLWLLKWVPALRDFHSENKHRRLLCSQFSCLKVRSRAVADTSLVISVEIFGAYSENNTINYCV
ncbi:hypothetical protein CPB84DRAFT_1828851, partial [Gymnopilus junonius]